VSFLRGVASAIRFMALPREQRTLCFYSEGRNYWPHLQGLVEGALDNSDLHVCYVSSGADDPGLKLEHPRLHLFEIHEGCVRNWFFENLESDMLVMTMPDLNNFQIKRSPKCAEYVYVQHSLVSLHMAYRPGAFDHFDTIFCAGPHHVEEVRAIETQRSSKPKVVVEHGYPRLEALLTNAESQAASPPADHILIAPSWGPEGLVESGLAAQFIPLLLAEGYQVTLRPHPQTNRFAGDKIKHIAAANQVSRFELETSVDGFNSLAQSTIMISDWSGAAFEYALGFDKPVLFVDIPRKVNNPDYREIALQPIEEALRDNVGLTAAPDPQAIVQAAGELLFQDAGNRSKASDIVFNIGHSDEAGVKWIVEQLAARAARQARRGRIS